MNGMHRHDLLLDTSDPIGVAIVVLGTLATVLAFVLAFRMTMWPGETDPAHPKHVILREDR